MPLSGSFFSKTFVFGFDARTSRGRMREKRSWFIRLIDTQKPDVVGVGECGPLPGLSVDDVPNFEAVLSDVLERVEGQEVPHDAEEWVRDMVPARFPAITFGLETALLDLIRGGKRLLFDNDFIRGVPIPINGLVWMNDVESMLDQAHQLVERGFTCIKIKVGGCDFEEEYRMLRAFRDLMRTALFLRTRRWKSLSVSPILVYILLNSPSRLGQVSWLPFAGRRPYPSHSMKS